MKNYELHRARTMLKMVQGDVSKKSGMSVSLISQIESGRITPKPEEKQKIAAALGCTIEEIFKGDE